jgi:hypothetical protein
MNAQNALIFTFIGSVMEFLPVLLPSWFPRNCADQASTRALWLGVMGAAQIAMGVGFIIWAHALPAFARIFSGVPAGEQLPLPLPSSGVAAGR